jgi:hypothetical protein
MESEAPRRRAVWESRELIRARCRRAFAAALSAGRAGRSIKGKSLGLAELGPPSKLHLIV